MQCSLCRLPSSYNRAVVDTVQDEPLGCLCTQCIDEFFGRLLDRYEKAGRSCLLCDRDGSYALPEWSCRTVEDESEVVVSGLEVTVEDATPRLCERHFSEFRAEKLPRVERETTNVRDAATVERS
ncbi:hypothetical protein VB773_14700 [Haloarculaceae archaeon H-GB2-1]|nr:hypothetical protein [Haloarculaceae archaeon H-GB1-1]MEA5387195.1 hypothetical protein [Haloarculaceae archaeon H-GB11]MEA5408690.1 hypothetical protein [Haloarculaceae archaeon H-GB2-1]